MSCSPYDLRDYLYEELTAGQRGEVRLHLKSCAPCTAELQSLRLTQSALLALHDEDIPQRIGFVSDKVFEPSPLRRWFAGFWNSAARLGFVSAALLSAAILVHPLVPAQPVHKDAQSAQITPAEIDRRVQAAVTAQLDAKLQTAVAQAVSETEDRAQKRTKEMLAVAERRHDFEQQAIRAEFSANLDYLRSKYNVAMVSATNLGAGQ